MDMNKYVPPSVAMVLPKLDETCSVLVQDRFKRAMTDYTKELCEKDPELADIILEGTKSLPRCILYVLQQAQQQVLAVMEATPDDELHQLGEVKIHGIMARMAGAAVEKEQLFGWAKNYYYGGKDVEPKDATTLTRTTGPINKQSATKKVGKDTKNAKTKKAGSTGKGSTENSGTKPAVASPGATTNPETHEGTQIGFDDLATAASSDAKDNTSAA